jgi:hypothetical protein
MTTLRYWGHNNDGETLAGLEVNIPAIICPTYYGFKGGEILSVTVEAISATITTPPLNSILGIYSTGGLLLAQSSEVALTASATEIEYTINITLPAGDYCIGISTDADEANFIALKSNNTITPTVSNEALVYSETLPATLTINDEARQTRLSVKYIPSDTFLNLDTYPTNVENLETYQTNVTNIAI